MDEDAQSIDPLLRYGDVPVIVCNMWANLAETLRGAIPDTFISGDFEKALRVAWLAEACYWQSLGESGSAYVKDTLAKALPSNPGDRKE